MLIALRQFGGKKDGFAHPELEQNNYSGLTWGLLQRGKVFSKLATHPVILEVARRLLGDNCRLSSISANTVMDQPQISELKILPNYPPAW